MRVILARWDTDPVTGRHSNYPRSAWIRRRWHGIAIELWFGFSLIIERGKWGVSLFGWRESA